MGVPVLALGACGIAASAVAAQLLGPEGLGRQLTAGAGPDLDFA